MGTLILTNIFIKCQLIQEPPGDLVSGFPEPFYLEVAITAQREKTNHHMEADTLEIPWKEPFLSLRGLGVTQPEETYGFISPQDNHTIIGQNEI